MKRLIIPILIGLLMFGAAFGGAFYFYRHQQAKAAGHMKEVVGQSLDALRQQGRVAIFSGRFVALMPSRLAAAADAAPVPALIVPGTVRYEIDLAALRDKDAVWQEEKRVLSVRLPSLLLSDPALEGAGIRQLGEGGAGFAPAAGAAMLDAAGRDAARAELLKQARAGDAMNLARDAARALVERAFAAALREDGTKARVELHFADEQVEEDGAKQAGQDDMNVPASSYEVAVPAAGNAMDQHQGGNHGAAGQEE